eukprot:scaffold1996_cov132-Isochrysis_galbana.AAC.11
MRTPREAGEPIGEAGHGGHADVQADDGVAHGERAINERLGKGARRLSHGVVIGRVEGEGGGRQAVSDEVDPEELHGH